MGQTKDTLPSLDQTLERLAATEKKFPDAERVRQTREALESNQRFAGSREMRDRYAEHLRKREMLVPIYGLGKMPWGLPVCLPRYLMEILEASARVLYAVARQGLIDRGPQQLLDKVPKGWLSEQMAERLHRYYLATEPDLAFDFLIYGKNSPRGTTFEELVKKEDQLHAKALEAQSVDTYPGWIREMTVAARGAGIGGEWQMNLSPNGRGGICGDDEIHQQVIATLLGGLEPERTVFMEVTPDKQPSAQNLLFMAEMMSGDTAHRPAILDPTDLELRGERLFARRNGKEHELRKIISRIVHVDLESWIAAQQKAGKPDQIESLKRIYDTPAVWPDLSKHLGGFYLIDKQCVADLSRTDGPSVVPRSEVITPEQLERYRRDPSLLEHIAIKPLHGMSALDVNVKPTLATLEEAVASQPMLAQELIWATPVLPNVNPDVADPDAAAGICVECRLILHAGSPAVPHEPNRARVLCGLGRTHYQAKDPQRRIPNDPKKRGWYSNIGAIMAVKNELGLKDRDDSGLGMAPIYWRV